MSRTRFVIDAAYQESLGEERIQQVQADWQDLFDQVQVEMAKGTDLTAAPVKALARRSIELIQAFTGGDPGVEQALNRMWQQEQPEVVSRGMVDAAMMEYLARARSALEQSE
ncbi:MULTISPECIES: TipAS antibiotic-recognition domain-containing protein [Leptolyngbya]|uniref:TipAS antibiotic-recognition domain-containing protein n=1 Tax=Leptolyngbya TaxID=47251 RepID=UPI001682707A|nr:TipAS antibiotic-recognition domain-containing protein [Leptolyngbya sp. FACHB-1624]MBD1859336.1 TipAS antibiotic-recognition domain-containing protein [Leptolyngbya sp. FACHB-1624]